MPNWLNTLAKVVAVVAVVATTALVITGTGGAGAVVALGVACSAATGGYFNEKAGGNFASGYVGGAVSGLTQSVSGQALGPVGTTIGGSVGSGLGTYITESIDNYFVSDEDKKSQEDILKNSAVTALVAIGPSSVTGCASAMTRAVTNGQNHAIHLMTNWSSVTNNMFGSFIGAIDDAATYIIIQGNTKEETSRK